MATANDAAGLMAAVQALVRRFSLVERADIACCGMTVAQAATLDALLRDDSVSLTELRRRLGITPSTLTRNLDRLRSRGLVETSPDPNDRRASQVSLTAAGRDAAAEVAAQEQAFAESIVAALGAAHSHEVLAALDTLLQAIRVASRGCCPGAFDHLMTTSIWNRGGNPHGELEDRRPARHDR
jgi:DNA-binding MarR family transcriptional regulator